MSGFRFECTQCGACCRRPGVVVLRNDEVKRIAEFRGERVYDLVMACDLESRDDGGWWLRMRGQACPFLVDDRCSIQEVKPRQCRAYPFWPEFVEDAEAWDAERELCPGMGLGPVWAASDVQAMLNLLDE